MEWRHGEIVIIGAGVLGTAIGVTLVRQGVSVRAVASRTAPSARRAAQRIDEAACGRGAAVEICEDPCEAARHADLLVLAVPDREIAPLAERLSHAGCLRPGALVVHLSGALPSDVLGAVRAAGACAGSMHPLQSFADVELAVRNLPSSPVFIEGDDVALTRLAELAGLCGGPVHTIHHGDKPLYHAAACIACNYFVTLLWAALRIYRTIGIDEQQALAALKPILDGTLENVFRLGPVRALTGPIARGDAMTVEAHLAAFDEAGKLPDVKSLYSLMGLHTLVLAFCRGLAKEDADRVREALRASIEG